MAEAGTLICICGRSFAYEYAYSNHQRQCKKTKRVLSGALEKAKEVWNAKKRRRIDGPLDSNDDQANEAGGLAAKVRFAVDIQGI